MNIKAMPPREVLRGLMEYLAAENPVTLMELQSAYVKAVLRQHAGSKINAAIALGLSNKELHDLMADIALAK